MVSSDAGTVVRPWIVIAIMVAGCSGNGLVTCTGRVQCDGEFVASGAISFHPLEGRSAPRGAQIVAGRYRIRVPRGRYRVEIVATRPRKDGVELTPGMLPQEQYIPSRYNAASTLEAQVTASSNDFSFDLSTREDE